MSDFYNVIVYLAHKPLITSFTILVNLLIQSIIYNNYKYKYDKIFIKYYDFLLDHNNKSLLFVSSSLSSSSLLSSL